MAIKDALASLAEIKKYTRLQAYRPYGHPDTLYPDGILWQHMAAKGSWGEWSNKPWQMEFHEAGANHQERMLMAANRPGKTVSAAAEVAIHMTGRYPDWWTGKRFTGPVSVWTGSPTNETSRDIVQKELVGGTDTERWGSGMVPRECLVGKPKLRQAGVSDVLDQFKARHSSGGISYCTLKTYEQGWRKWQGTAPDIVWLDEEPDMSQEQRRIYSEALTRLLTSHGIMLVTFTPLLGQTDLVTHFQTGGDGVWMGSATWEDAPHLLKAERTRLASSYPAHELQARTKGVPMMGEGRIFTAPEEDITCDPFELPRHYAQVIGMDFGMDHPTAAARCAWDRDKDIFYVTDVYRKEQRDSLVHAEVIKRRMRGDVIPVSWPHDGANREKGSGKNLKDIYRDHGLKMLGKSARYDNDKGGSQGQWKIITEVQERAKTDRFKVFSTCTEFFEEYRNYHTKDGKIVDRRDDVLKAVFYALMMKRFATPFTRTVQQHSSAPILTTRL
jgi:phage terminase large subunit-like protein